VKNKSTDYVDVVRLAISLGDDTDTLACIAGGIAHSYYKSIPAEIVATARFCLPEVLREIIDAFSEVYEISI